MDDDVGSHVCEHAFDGVELAQIVVAPRRHEHVGGAVAGEFLDHIRAEEALAASDDDAPVLPEVGHSALM